MYDVANYLSQPAWPSLSCADQTLEPLGKGDKKRVQGQ